MALWSSDLQVGVLQNLANHETLYIRYHVLIGCYLVGHFFFLLGTILMDTFFGGKDNISIFGDKDNFGSQFLGRDTFLG